MTNNTQLLPCPFCGAPVRMEDQGPLYRIAGNHTGTCPLSLEEPLVSSPGQWNTRAPAESATCAKSQVGTPAEDVRAVVKLDASMIGIVHTHPMEYDEP